MKVEKKKRELWLEVESLDIAVMKDVGSKRLIVMQIFIKNIYTG